MAIPDVTNQLLGRVAEHDFAAAASVADVVDEWDACRIVADGRAPDLVQYNHAALVRAGPEDVDKALEKAERYYGKRQRRAAVVLDPLTTPGDLPERLAARGYRPEDPALDLELWDPEAPHLFSAPEVYMTLATNATLDAWLDIATSGLEEAPAAQARAMQTLEFRAQGFTFWFGLFGGTPAGACPLFVKDGIARVGPVRVAEEYRNRGVGLALVNYVTRQSRKDGATVTYLHNEPDGPATRLLRTAGYHPARRRATETWIHSEG
jgi:GNAT superfamily N-acetyltransferase